MKNKNKNAMPMSYFGNNFGTDGLSKLEYAVIHIAAGVAASEPGLYCDHVARVSIAIAEQIFKQLEDDNTPVVSDTEL